MAEAVFDAITRGRHTIVQAGTGTGKSLAYLVPVMLSGRKTVIATVTKALQDQLADKDLPLVTACLADETSLRPSWAVLKGRSNYLCLQRLDEMRQPSTLRLDDDDHLDESTLARLERWSASTDSGDLAAVDWALPERAARLVSVGSDECPGASRCPRGDECFAELARRRAADADVIVVNTHLYGLDVASQGAILPEHEVVVFDEAHQLEDVISDSTARSLSAGRIAHLVAGVRAVIRDDSLTGSLLGIADDLTSVLAPRVGTRLPVPLDESMTEPLVALRLKIDEALGTLGSLATDHTETKQRILRATIGCDRLVEEIDSLLAAANGSVAFVSGTSDRPVLELAPLNVGPTLKGGVWDTKVAILTSATMPNTLPDRVGLGDVDVLDVGSPFDYENNGLLYCAKHLPLPNHPDRDAAVHDELARLITAARGRTLALFTTYRAMHAAADALAGRIGFPIIRQGDLPKPLLLARFADDYATCLFATAGYFQGVDVPGESLSLVTIDKIPFPRPDDPLLGARRDQVGSDAFNVYDVPIAATQLAQAAGRLIRSATDTGVVAILDPRLATKGYGKRLVAALPPMPRTIEFERVAEFLDGLTRR
jgi:ATP-dependent DNA helicase DinG